MISKIFLKNNLFTVHIFWCRKNVVVAIKELKLDTQAKGSKQVEVKVKVEVKFKVKVERARLRSSWTL